MQIKFKEGKLVGIEEVGAILLIKLTGRKRRRHRTRGEMTMHNAPLLAQSQCLS